MGETNESGVAQGLLDRVRHPERRGERLLIRQTSSTRIWLRACFPFPTTFVLSHCLSSMRFSIDNGVRCPNVLIFFSFFIERRGMIIDSFPTRLISSCGCYRDIDSAIDWRAYYAAIFFFFLLNANLFLLQLVFRSFKNYKRNIDVVQ